MAFLEQVKREDHTFFEQLKFLVISGANLDDFFMIRVGSLYNYIDYGRKRIDNSGLTEIAFRKKLLTECDPVVISRLAKEITGDTSIAEEKKT